MPKSPENLKEIQSLVQVVADLRGPEGCPWDKAQDHRSLTRYAIEETFEMVEALEQREELRENSANSKEWTLATQNFKEELGDVLFQVVLHSQLASEERAFTFDDVIETLSEKLVRRHPHVFAEVKVSGTDEVWKNWEQIKIAEKQKKGEKQGLIQVPESLPALQRAGVIGEKTRKLKFDWQSPDEVWLKVEEEIAELREAMDHEEISEIQHEIGDALFSLAQLARHYELDPEQILRQANRRFLNRFEKMVRHYADSQKVASSPGESLEETLKKFSQLSNEDKEKFWALAKKN